MAGERMNEVSCVSRRSRKRSYSTLEERMRRSNSAPCARRFSSMCSRTRAWKKRSRDTSNKIPERCSIRARISLNSWSVSCRPFCIFSGTWTKGCYRFLFVQELLATCRCQGSGIARLFHRIAVAGDAELRQRFIQLFREFHHVLHGAGRLTRALRGLASDVRDDLHGVGNTLRATHLLLGSQRELLHQLRGLADNAGNRFQRFAGLICQASAHFHFLGAFFHHHHGLIGLRLNGLDRRGNVFGGGA